MRFTFLISLLLLLIFTSSGYARFVAVHSSSTSLISDGQNLGSKSIIKTVVSEEEACKWTYGFMPCTKTSALGNVFLILIYGFFMYKAATYLSYGSELLLEILGPGIVGGLFLPMLGAFPDAMLILVSGLSGDPSAAQSQIAVGMGSLAGSTVILLTVIWGTCTVVGKCDLQDSIAVETQDTKGFHLKDSGVTVDVWTSYAARIMAISIIPFVIVQLPQMLGSTSGRNLSILVALVMSVLMLISYCVYQVFQPWIQKKRLAYVELKHVISGFLKNLKRLASGRLLDDKGHPHERVIRRLFTTIDTNNDGHLSAAELKAFIIGISFEGIDFDKDDAVASILQEFDMTQDEQVDENEFFYGITHWILHAMGAVGTFGPENRPPTMNILQHFHVKTKREHTLLGVSENEVRNGEVSAIKAVLMLLLGAAIAAAFINKITN